jgi:hypothetical protein
MPLLEKALIDGGAQSSASGVQGLNLLTRRLEHDFLLMAKAGKCTGIHSYPVWKGGTRLCPLPFKSVELGLVHLIDPN